MTKIKDLVEKYGNREIDEVELEKILKPIKKTIYNLEKGDTYWFINSCGQINDCKWYNDDIDEERLSVGSVCLTQEEAEYKVEYRIIKSELKRYASLCEIEVDWSDENQVKYALEYNHKFEILDVRPKWFTSDSDIFFTNHSILENAIKEIGKERIIKYYLGIKGETK